MTHTKEPWQTGIGSPWMVRADGVPSVAMFTFAEDAARAVASVNALAGLNPEGVRELVEAARGVNQSTDDGFWDSVRRLEAALAKVEQP